MNTTLTTPRTPRRSSLAQRVVAIIPAWNEAETIGAVIRTARAAKLVDEVIVVDNASTDATGAVALHHGARVIREATPGKGQAMRTGVASTDAEIILFLDADLIGLRVSDIDDMARRLLNDDVDMACGLFDRGPAQNPVFLRALPILTGQRAMRRELFEQLDEEDLAGYRVEAALNSLVAQHDLRRHDQVWDGLWHHTKEEKFENPIEGFSAKVQMLTTAAFSYVRFAVRHRNAAPAAFN